MKSRPALRALRASARRPYRQTPFVMEVRDNGCGIPADWDAKRGTLGILGMRERAADVGGEVVVEGFPGQGTAVTLRIPDFASVHAT